MWARAHCLCGVWCLALSEVYGEGEKCALRETVVLEGFEWNHNLSGRLRAAEYVNYPTFNCASDGTKRWYKLSWTKKSGLSVYMVPTCCILEDYQLLTEKVLSANRPDLSRVGTSLCISNKMWHCYFDISLHSYINVKSCPEMRARSGMRCCIYCLKEETHAEQWPSARWGRYRSRRFHLSARANMRTKPVGDN